MQKHAIVSAAFGPRYEAMTKITWPAMQSYSQRIGADFIPFRERKFVKTTPHWEKLQVGAVLADYDRVLWLDVDTLVRPDTPSLFEVVPIGTVGAYDESFSKYWDYPNFFVEWSRLSGMPAAEYKGYHFNTGVLVVDRSHRELFETPPVFADYNVLWEQTYLNYGVARGNIPYLDITAKFNHMYNSPGFRLDSCIIHYCGTVNGAGYAKFIPPGGTYLDLMRADWEAWKTVSFNG